MLKAEDLHVYYGDSHVLFGPSFEVNAHETVCLIGRNGMGKSTTMRSIIGLLPIRQGSITFDGKDITREPSYRRGRMGIGYVPEDRGLFPRLSAGENLRLSAIGAHSGGINDALDVFPELKRYLNTQSQSLSGGEQQMLAIGRGIVGDRKILLLDECTQGLAPKVCERLREALGAIKKRMPLLLVEQNVNFALDLADRVYIMKDGRIAFEGKPEQVREDPSVQALLTTG